MKVIKRKQAKSFSNSANCSGLEYDLDDKNLDGAVINISGRYPETGKIINQSCKEVAYIISGQGRIEINEKSFEVKSEDMVAIDKGEPYYWDGHFKLFVYCTPSWSSDQHKHLA